MSKADEDHEAFGAMVYRGKVEASERSSTWVKLTLGDVISEVMGVPPRTTVLVRAVEEIVDRLASEGITVHGRHL